MFRVAREGEAVTDLPPRRLEPDGRRAILRFPYDADLVAAVKQVPGARWHAAERYWSAPLTEAVLEFARERFFYVPAGVRVARTAAGAPRRPKPPADPAKPLTARQAAALGYITEAGPAGIGSAELGARMHAYRQAQGGKGHAADTMCDWCASEGRSVAEALRGRLLIYKRERRYWCLTEHRGASVPREVGAYDPRTAEIPF